LGVRAQPFGREANADAWQAEREEDIVKSGGQENCVIPVEENCVIPVEENGIIPVEENCVMSVEEKDCVMPVEEETVCSQKKKKARNRQAQEDTREILV
jgi:hypothetical protein